jgi:hypothetical protein
MSNNKQIMKLYTEEQVNELRRALRDIAQWDEDLEDDWEDAGNRAMDALRCFENLTPIELPSDEDIYNEAQIKKDNIKLLTFDMASFQFGAMWLKDKIQGGNK